ncbi:hypothetical protein K9U39_14320 [Rhodoblastus acidophilus]|nr:hypothetical protein [Rhodoblastus acidophilus]
MRRFPACGSLVNDRRTAAAPAKAEIALAPGSPEQILAQKPMPVGGFGRKSAPRR